MHYIFLALLLSLFFSNSKAQSPEIDSLNTLLKTETNDTIYASTLYRICALQSRYSMDSLKVYLEKLRDYCENSTYKRGLALAYKGFGNYYGMMGQEDSSLISYQNAVKACANQCDSHYVATLYYTLGSTYAALRQIDSAMRNLSEAKQIAQLVGDSGTVRNVHSELGKYYKSSGNLDSALHYHLEALKTSKAIGEYDAVIFDLKFVAQLYRTMDRNELALKYFQEAIDLAEEMDFLSAVTDPIDGMANVYMEMDSLDKALELLEKGERVADETNNFISRLTMYSSLGKVHRKLGNETTARDYYQRSCDLAAESGDDNFYVAYASFNMGDFERLMDNFSVARPWIAKAIQIWERDEEIDRLQEAYLGMSLVEKELSNYENALENYEKYIEVRDTILNEERINAMEEMKTKYETEKKDKELAEQTIIIAEDEKERAQLKTTQQRLAFSLGGAGLLLVGGLLFYFRERKASETKQALLQSEQEKLQARQKQLEAEVDVKNRELAAKATAVIRKNELLADIRGQLKESLRRVDNVSAGNFRELNHSIDSNLDVDKDWNDFRLQFEANYPDFFSKLKSRFENLTDNDLQLCAYSLIKLPMKDVADAMHIAIASVKKARNRLRKKLEIDSNTDLTEFLRGV